MSIHVNELEAVVGKDAKQLFFFGERTAQKKRPITYQGLDSITKRNLCSVYLLVAMKILSEKRNSLRFFLLILASYFLNFNIYLNFTFEYLTYRMLTASTCEQLKIRKHQFVS